MGLPVSLSKWHNFTLTCLVAGVLSALPLPSEAAAATKLPTKPFVYKAVNVQLVDLLRDFAGAQGLPLVIADGVSGIVNANFQFTPEAFLDTVSKAFGLIWYFDGVALYVYPSSQIQTRLISLRDLNVESVEAKLAGFGLGDRRYPLRVQRGVGLALVFGPPRHIELVEAVIGALSEVQKHADSDGVRTFALTYASAVDRTVQGVRLPGVASTLTSIYQEKAAGASSTGPAAYAGAVVSDTFAKIDRLEGSPDQIANRDGALRGVARSITSGSTKSVAPNTPATSGAIFTPPEAQPGAGKLVFSADEATNTVIARGPAEKLREIEKLIARLDMQSEMIEIEATIIDIASDEVEGLGFDWRYVSNSRDVQISPALGAASVNGAIPQGGSFNITTLFRGSAWELISRIRALESRGTARVVSQPKVLGAANRTALLSDKRTASVRVAGNQDAKLYSVEAGTLLQMVPRLVLDPMQTRIGLDLLIEDGGFSAESVDQVPIVQKTTIRTDVMINEGQSILIGGIVVDNNRSSRSAVPWLSKLPLLGAAFRLDESGASKRQRLFLLTPKRVVLATRDAGSPDRSASPQPSMGAPRSATPGSEIVEPRAPFER